VDDDAITELVWSDDAFADTPPEWAIYEEYGMHGDQCGQCGAWCSIVRPGKTQCNVCGDDAGAGSIDTRSATQGIKGAAPMDVNNPMDWLMLIACFWAAHQIAALAERLRSRH